MPWHTQGPLRHSGGCCNRRQRGTSVRPLYCCFWSFPLTAAATKPVCHRNSNDVEGLAQHHDLLDQQHTRRHCCNCVASPATALSHKHQPQADTRHFMQAGNNGCFHNQRWHCLVASPSPHKQSHKTEALAHTYMPVKLSGSYQQSHSVCLFLRTPSHHNAPCIVCRWQQPVTANI